MSLSKMKKVEYCCNPTICDYGEDNGHINLYSTNKVIEYSYFIGENAFFLWCHKYYKKNSRVFLFM